MIGRMLLPVQINTGRIGPQGAFSPLFLAGFRVRRRSWQREHEEFGPRWSGSIRL
jgi:hypothetical protein